MLLLLFVYIFCLIYMHDNGDIVHMNVMALRLDFDWLIDTVLLLYEGVVIILL